MGNICNNKREQDLNLCLTQSKIEEQVIHDEIQGDISKLKAKKTYTVTQQEEIQQLLYDFAAKMTLETSKLRQLNKELVLKLHHKEQNNLHERPRKKFRILCIDGGGMRGLTVAQIFDRLDKEVPGWSSKVDFIAGTSTGSILASFIARGDKGEQIKDLYLKNGSKIFETFSFLHQSVDLYGLKGPKFNQNNIKGILEGYFGKMVLKDFQKKILITSFDLDGNPLLEGQAKSLNSWRGKFFHNFNNEGDDKLVDCLMASTAAPTYFSVYRGFTDGGVIANSPSMCALAQAINPKYGNVDLEDIVLLSVGCGKFNKTMDVSDPHKGLLDWALPLLEILFEGQGESAQFQCESLLGDRVFRMEPLTAKALDSFSADQDNISALQKVANEYDLNPAVDWLNKYWVTD